MAAPNSNQILAGRYNVLRPLEKGGFGQTYIAEDILLPGSPWCVVKHLEPASSNPRFLEDARRLFLAEAETLQQLGKHDQIPQLLAYFEEDQEFYLVQEFVEGRTLAQELKPGQPWPESKIIQMLVDVLSVLSFVHKHQVIHRDIKPENLIRRADEKLVLVDFGTVKQIRNQLLHHEHATRTIAVGTPGYMPTEQNHGQPRFSSDIYALGIIGIQAATGLFPKQLHHDSVTGELIWQPWARIGQDLMSVLTDMVRYHFKDRYESAEQALAAIDRLGLRELAASVGAESQSFELATTHSIHPLRTTVISGHPDDAVAEAAHLSDPPESALENAIASSGNANINSISADPLSAENSAQSPVQYSTTQNGAPLPLVTPPTHTEVPPIQSPPSPTVVSAPPSSELDLSAQTDSSPQLEDRALAPHPLGDELSSSEQDLPVDNSATKPFIETLDLASKTQHSPDVTEPQTDPEHAETDSSPATGLARLLSPPILINALLLFGLASLVMMVSIPIVGRKIWQMRVEDNQPIDVSATSGLMATLNASPLTQPCQEGMIDSQISDEPDFVFNRGTEYYGPLNSRDLPTDGWVTMVYPRTDNRYDGEYRDGQREGCGKFTFADEDSPIKSYVGQFKDNGFNGQGVLTFSNGDRYIGSFKDTRCQGKGIYVRADGTTESGEWNDDQQVGGDLTCSLEESES